MVDSLEALRKEAVVGFGGEHVLRPRPEILHQNLGRAIGLGGGFGARWSEISAHYSALEHHFRVPGQLDALAVI